MSVIIPQVVGSPFSERRLLSAVLNAATPWRDARAGYIFCFVELADTRACLLVKTLDMRRATFESHFKKLN